MGSGGATKRGVPALSVIDFVAWLREISFAAEETALATPKSANKKRERKPAATIHNVQPKKDDALSSQSAPPSASAKPEAAEPNVPTTCPSCSASPVHKLTECSKFKALSRDDRGEIIKAGGYCFRCIDNKHHARKCKVKVECTVADCDNKAKHHTLGHKPMRTVKTHHVHVNHQSTHAIEEEDVMLLVVPVSLEVGDKRVHGYAFLDSGSKCTLVTEETARQLAIPGKNRDINFNGFHEEGKGKVIPSRRVSFAVRSLEDQRRFKMTGVFTVPKITIGNKARYESFCPEARWPYLRRVLLPAIDASRVSVLIGMDNADALICADHVLPPVGVKGPIAFKTQFGWALGGPTSKPATKGDRRVHYIRPKESDEQLAKAFERCCAAEVDGTQAVGTTVRSEEDEQEEAILKSTAKCTNHEWTVALMFRDQQPMLPSNQEFAMSRFTQQERRLKKKPDYAERYDAVAQAYLDAGHAERETPEEAANRPP